MQYGFQILNNKMLRLFAVLTGRKTYEHAIFNPVNLLKINYNFQVELINNWKSITNSIGVVYIVYVFIGSPKGYKASVPYHILRLYILLSPVFTFFFPSYIFLIVTSGLTFSLIFYLFSARFATPRTPRSLSFLLSILHSNLFSTLSYLSPHSSPRPPRSLYLSYLPILMFHTYFLLLYMFIHFLYTVSFPSPFDFRFFLIRSIFTFILVPLLSHLRFFLF